MMMMMMMMSTFIRHMCTKRKKRKN